MISDPRICNHNTLKEVSSCGSDQPCSKFLLILSIMPMGLKYSHTIINLIEKRPPQFSNSYFVVNITPDEGSSIKHVHKVLGIFYPLPLLSWIPLLDKGQVCSKVVIWLSPVLLPLNCPRYLWIPQKYPRMKQRMCGQHSCYEYLLSSG